MDQIDAAPACWTGAGKETAVSHAVVAEVVDEHSFFGSVEMTGVE